ncbi:hypothetical protein GCM10009804_17580 [Kribbella hippodromi]|uniref:Uncharacterized protein n=1 Tax=Kribbella hippodromi TaxID=434347 RepID=A0ABN2CMN2_9ACTN
MSGTDSTPEDRDRIVKAIHDGRPDPNEAFNVKDGDNVLRVEPIGDVSRRPAPGKAPNGKRGGRTR